MRGGVVPPPFPFPLRLIERNHRISFLTRTLSPMRPLPSTFTERNGLVSSPLGAISFQGPRESSNALALPFFFSFLHRGRDLPVRQNALRSTKSRGVPSSPPSFAALISPSSSLAFALTLSHACNKAFWSPRRPSDRPPIFFGGGRFLSLPSTLSGLSNLWKSCLRLLSSIPDSDASVTFFLKFFAVRSLSWRSNLPFSDVPYEKFSVLNVSNSSTCLKSPCRTE